MSTAPATDTKAFRTTATEAPSGPTSVQFRSQNKPHPSTNTAPMPPKVSTQTAQQKKASRRSSKPIINWFQRKLAGSGKAKRVENVPRTIADPGLGRTGSGPNRQIGRITSSPLPSINPKHQGKIDTASVTRRKTRSISLNGDESIREFNQLYADDDLSLDHSSLNRESIWSPASALEADDDASVRPIPPSGPPSPSPSRSSSSYLSDPRTFRSIAASTKPTTLLSIDLNGNGMAHIAQAPPTNPAPTQFHRFPPHVRQSSLSNAGLLGSGGSITFSALPSAQPTSRPTSLRNPGSLSMITQQQPAHTTGQVSSVQAPLHTTHHPRNNPRPSSPPLDNASLLTLASSAFGMPNRAGTQGYTPSAIGDSVSHYGGSITFPDAESTSQFVLGDDDRLEERDFDASVRALRPRSSRRGSWESEASRWSARIQGTGTPSLLRERSLWTSNSIRTGGVSFENGEVYETADDQLDDEILDLEKENGVVVEGVTITIGEHKPTQHHNNPMPEQQEPETDDPTPETNLSEANSEVCRSSTDTIAHIDQPSEGQPKVTGSPRGPSPAK